ncbi:MAG: 4a-hydroxytetrahydrobiopterin dehydratase [Planctomycetota bacterium]
MAVPPLASPEQVDAALASLRGWARLGEQLTARYVLPTFAEAVAFTTKIATVADQQNHHPEWRVAYRDVELLTTTHDAGGLTRLDLELAERIAAIADECGAEAADGDDVQVRGHTWVPPGHFYSPIVNRDEVRADAGRLFSDELRVLHGVDLRIDEQLALVRELLPFYGEEDFADGPVAGRRYHTDNDYFGFVDAWTLYAVLRHLRPRRVIEVGSGWSSAVLLDTDERFLGARTECTFIEPYPERLLSLMTDADRQRTRLLRSRLQDVDLAEFARLEAGDVLFVDSSHVAKTGSDVVHALFEVLPTLQAGVWVHFHDVHGNFEYSREWVEQGRSWNESYFLRAFLMHNREWQVMLHSPSLELCAAHELVSAMPRMAGGGGGSLWLRRG